MGTLQLHVSLQACNGPAQARPRRLACRATAAPSGPSNTLLVKVVETLFRFPPIFNAAAASARRMIIQRGEAMGVDFAAQIEELRAVDWASELEAATDPAVQTPNYYKAPFHAYTDGNLCWEAALEVSAAAQSVHAVVYDPAGKTLDPQGDTNLRNSFQQCTTQLLAQLGARPVADVLDVGCATGLSSLALLRAFPGARVTGIDLSPHFVAVGRHLQRQREQRAGRPEPLALVHGLAEDSRLPAGSFDLVSTCLVFHELPQAPARAILQEAFRLLRPGGALAIMEMNPRSEVFQRVFSNPFPYVAFKSTEPYLIDYVTLDLHAAIQEAGFGLPAELYNSPRHRTIVAVKPTA